MFVKYSQCREEERKFDYLYETWVHEGHTASNGWAYTTVGSKENILYFPISLPE
jgi:hypothetical protein